MSSEAITRNDLTAILNEVLPFSFTEFRHHKGTVTVPTATLVQMHSETFESGSWLILTTIETLTNGSVTVNLGQNRILENSTLVYAHKGVADNNIVNTNFYVLQSASNTTITLESFQATGNSQSQEWTFTAIRIGDKFAQPEADYIVEQGTEGIWTYRKWASGIAECWGVKPSATYNQSGTWGSAYYTATSVDLPSGLFTSLLHANIEKNDSSAGLIWTSINVRTTALSSPTSISFYVCDTNSGSRTVEFNVYVIGRWK